MGSKDLAEFCRQFSTMLSCGISIIQCLNILSRQAENKTLVRATKGLVELLANGQSLAQAAGSYPKVFPKIFASMLEAGEISGSLDQIMERLSIHFEKEHDLREKIKSAMTYPAIVLMVAIIAVAAMIILVLPTFVNMLNEYNAELPFATRALLSLLMSGYWYVLPGVLTIIFLIFKHIATTTGGKTFIDSLSLRIPVFGGLIKRIIIARFARTLAILLASGVPLLQAFDVVKRVVGNAIVEKAIIEANQCVREGQGIALPLQQSGVFPPMVTRMIAIGEETGALDSMLEKLAQFYEREVGYLVSRLASTIEPILVVAMGGVIGFIILSIMLPIFSVMNSVQ
ncbi:type II secretion system F family protein [Desulfotruncus arcticus]|uniref:type II secretion system F family protein n=1 Tax=Desulfotruncus arcticus TaxID=341036 RepID=UPI0013F4BE55|nr:type II secretion system F family protein [Desulfotruncus arcticus]